MQSQCTTYPASANWATLFVSHSPRRVFESRDPSDFEPERIFIFGQRIGCAARDLVGYGNARDRLHVAIVVRALVRPCLALATSHVVVRERQLRDVTMGMG